VIDGKISVDPRKERNMDILAFVKPKREIIYVFDDFSISEALKTMEEFRFTSIPILSREGNYVGTLTEGDLLWGIKNLTQFDMEKANQLPISALHRLRDYETINVMANIDELIIKASNENFVPVVDDKGYFIGIVTRKTLLNYFFEHNFIVL
jgi:CBS domain-containing protein